MRNLFKILILGGFLLIVFALAQDIVTQANKFDEISSVEKQARDLERENSSLRESAERAKNPFELEKQARDKLGYQKPGEILYVTNFEDKSDSGNGKRKANWEEWLDLFF